MIPPAAVSAVLVTRGDQLLDDIVDQILGVGIVDIVVWNNSVRENLSCYGRYKGIELAQNEWIYQQDDDLIAPVGKLLREFDPVADRYTIVANNDVTEPWRLTGRGVVFHRSLADCFFEYKTLYGDGPRFNRIADIVFAYQHPYRVISLGYKDLPWADAPDRMYLEPDHYTVREEAYDRVRRLASRTP